MSRSSCCGGVADTPLSTRSVKKCRWAAMLRREVKGRFETNVLKLKVCYWRSFYWNVTKRTSAYTATDVLWKPRLWLNLANVWAPFCRDKQEGKCAALREVAENIQHNEILSGNYSNSFQQVMLDLNVDSSDLIRCKICDLMMHCSTGLNCCTLPLNN